MESGRASLHTTRKRRASMDVPVGTGGGGPDVRIHTTPMQAKLDLIIGDDGVCKQGLSTPGGA